MTPRENLLAAVEAYPKAGCVLQMLDGGMGNCPLTGVAMRAGFTYGEALGIMDGFDVACGKRATFRDCANGKSRDHGRLGLTMTADEYQAGFELGHEAHNRWKKNWNKST
jgi:hypothetical protein